MKAAGIGVILTPRHGRRPDFARLAVAWGADNGCYSQGPAFRLAGYLAWLGAMAPARATCLFATLPDVVGDWAATLVRSLPVVERVAALGYRAAIVAQDGMAPADVAGLPAGIGALFLGGTTAFKLSETAYAIQRAARSRGLWTHMGRVNSRRRLRAAAVAGYDSADGTHLAFRPDVRTAQLLRWLGELERQPPLFVG